MKLEFYRQIFEKFSNIKFHENPSNGSRVAPCFQTDMMKLIAAFRDFANAPEITKKIRFMNNRYVSYGTLSQVSLVSLPLQKFARIPF